MHRVLALVALAACRQHDSQQIDRLPVDPPRPPAAKAAPVEPPEAPAPPVPPAEGPCARFGRELEVALAAVLHDAGRTYDHDRLASYVKTVRTACDIGADRPDDAACFAGTKPALERARTCGVSRLSYSELDRRLALGDPTAADVDQRAVIARAQGTWTSSKGARMRIAGTSATWTRSGEDTRDDVIVGRMDGPTELLIFERHTHELAIARDGRRLVTIASATAQEEPADRGPRLHDLGDGYGLVVEDRGCRGIDPAGKLVDATCTRARDSLTVTIRARTWSFVVIDRVLALASDVEGTYTHAR